MTDIKVDTPDTLNLNKWRALVKSYVEKHQYNSALFWADKVVSLSKNEVQDIYCMVDILYQAGQYHRAALMILKNNLHKRFAAARYLAAKCHFQCKEYNEALFLLDQCNDTLSPPQNGKIYTPGSPTQPTSVQSMETTPPEIPHEKIDSSIHLLRGQIYEALENRSLATECFREALRCDVFCYEAYENLVKHHMLTAREEKELLQSLPYKQQCTEQEIEMLQFLYENKLKKYKSSLEVVPKSLEILEENTDVRINQAERHYYNCEFRDALIITSEVLAKDACNEACLPLHVSTLVELKKTNDLFAIAHKLVDIYPDKAVSWFAVGCYYLLIKKNDLSRRYLSKATSLDRIFGPAWLAFGHSFAAENEHDQAMAAYFTASQIMRGCHLPVLYIGLEYGLTHNAKLAERFFGQALEIAPDDPFVLHEMGTVAFQNGDFEQAETHFKQALDLIESVNNDTIADTWEPLLNNLGHVCRKLKKYESALEYHRKALILSPQNASTFSAMGYVHSLTGNCFEAVDYFHKALGLRRDDTFSTTMLGYALEKLMSDVDPYEITTLDLPERPFANSLSKLSETRNNGCFGISQSESKSPEDEFEPRATLRLPTTPGDVLDETSDTSMMLETDMDDT